MFEKETFVKKNITWITICSIFAFALVIYVLSCVFGADSKEVIVLVDGQEQGLYSLETEQEIRIETDGGYNLLVIRDGQAYVAEADCDNQVCVHTRPIDIRGGQIICLPHRVVIRLNMTEKSEIDAVTN